MIRSNLHELLLDKLIHGMPYDLDSPEPFAFKTDINKLCNFLGFRNYQEFEQEYNSICEQYVLVPADWDFEQVNIYEACNADNKTCEFVFNRDFVIMYQAGLQELERRRQNDKK